MDEVDRHCVDVKPSPRPPFDMSNYPAPSEEQPEYDEVDRPGGLSERIEEKNVSDSNDDENEDTNKPDELNIKVSALGAAVNEVDHDFVVIDTPEILLSSTDGPFNNPFFSKQNPLIQRGFEKTDKEGITTKRTTYYPKQPDKKIDYTKYPFDSDYYYDMNTFPRGKFTLINVKYFQKSSGMADYPREGTDKDADGLCSLFLDFGFIVDRYDNPSKKEIISILKGAANDDYSKLSCCACSILSHGEDGIIYGTDGYVKIKEVTRLFRARGLAGKPKLFLFQACQGSEYMDPLDSVDGPGRSGKEIALTLPSEADFLYAYSTVPGYYSWRNSSRGSWFMEAVCAVFRQYSHKMDVVRMLTRVNAVVAHRKSRTDDVKTDNKRQIASIVTQMRKEFFLCSPYGTVPNSNPPVKF